MASASGPSRQSSDENSLLQMLLDITSNTGALLIMPQGMQVQTSLSGPTLDQNSSMVAEFLTETCNIPTEMFWNPRRS